MPPLPLKIYSMALSGYKGIDRSLYSSSDIKNVNVIWAKNKEIHSYAAFELAFQYLYNF